MKKRMMDRLSNLPDSVLTHILSLLPNPNKKAIVRSSVLSKRWRFLWKSVPISLVFSRDDCDCWEPHHDADFAACVNRELLLSRSFEKIGKFSVKFRYDNDKGYIKDIDLWVYFATQAANVDDFTLLLYYINFEYEFPQFAYMKSSLKNLVLRNCQMNPSGSVSWTSLVSLSIGDLKLTDEVMEKVLSGCPNLESLELEQFSGLYRLEISSRKLRKLIIRNSKMEGTKAGHMLEIFAPYVRNLQLLGFRHEMRLQLKDVGSLVTAFLDFTRHFDFYRPDDDDGVDAVCSYLKDLLHSLVHVKNLELGPWCIEFLSIPVLKGWQSPASSRRFLTLNTALVQQDFPAICSLLQSSPDLETLVIDWTKQTSRDLLLEFINENEKNGRISEKHIFDCSLLHLRAVKIINYYGPLRVNKFIMPLVKHLLKNAEVLEKMVIAASLRYNKFQGSDVSRDFVEMAQEFLSYPRSSKHAVVVFSY